MAVTLRARERSVARFEFCFGYKIGACPAARPGLFFKDPKMNYQMDESLLSTQFSSERYLWAGVIDRAFQDLKIRAPSGKITTKSKEQADIIAREQVLVWFFSKNQSIGSLIWICEHIQPTVKDSRILALKIVRESFVQLLSNIGNINSRDDSMTKELYGQKG